MAFSPRVSGSPFFKNVMNQFSNSMSSALTSSFKLRSFSGRISTLIAMDFQLRDALPGDSVAISRLEEQLFYENWMSEHSIRDELGRGPAWAAFFGYCLEGYLLTNYRARVLDIIRVAVHPSKQGMGVGARLMETALEYPCEMATLTVRKDNPVAIRLYKHLGFQLHGDLGPAWVLVRTSSKSTRARSGRTCTPSARRLS